MNPIITMLKNDLKMALGCTEPVAIAFACATAAKHSQGELKHLHLTLSGNIIKNVMGVGIPGTPFIGAKYAALLGFFKGDADAGLEALHKVKEDDMELIRQLEAKNLITIEVYDGEQKLYIGVEVEADNLVKVVVQKDHQLVTDLQVDEEVLISSDAASLDQVPELEFHLNELIDFAYDAPLSKIEFLEEGVELNCHLSDTGLTGYWGLQLGKQIQEDIEAGILKADLLTSVTGGVCSAIDARMSGAQEPAMTNSGSGNQGIITHLAPYFAAQYLGSSREQLLRALVLSNAIPMYMKNKLGKLSALCGVTPASAGVAAALTFLQQGSRGQIELAMKNVLAGISGMICDGAKPGCSLKVSSGIANAVHASALALHNRSVQAYEGIIDADIEDSIKHFVRLGLEGMAITDKVILDTMVNKA